jgi:putative mycofactocin binding protein MftB
MGGLNGDLVSYALDRAASVPRPTKESESTQERAPMGMTSRYKLRMGVQVRSENFGLLFYHYDGPKLYFVKSKNLVDEHFFSGKQSIGDLVSILMETRGWPEEAAQRQLSELMQLLIARGLVDEQPLC